jgi:SsrA-binding protein
MASKANKKEGGGATIALNKKAKHEYFIEQRFEAGLALEGWEAKSLRAGRVQLVDSYVLLRNNEAFLFGALITPLPTASTHISPDATRNRKLLLHRDELDRLIGAVERKGYTLIVTALYWKQGRAKAEVLQHTGSFKFRGGWSSVSALSPEERAKGVLAFSSGNHAQGVALAATKRGASTRAIGSTAIISIAASCSPAFISPISAVSEVPARPANSSALTTGPSSRTSDSATSTPSASSEP